MRNFLFFGCLFLLGNIGVNGQNWFGEKELVWDNINVAISIKTADLDYDGDVDIIAALYGEDLIVWYENDGTGKFNEQHTISNQTMTPSSVHTADVDSDGIVDVLSTSFEDGKVAWYKNDGAGNFGTQNIVSEEISYSIWDLSVVDTDTDGDMDIVYANEIGLFWHENDGNGNFEKLNVVTHSTASRCMIDTGDLDNDGNMDIVLASSEDNEVVWYKNDGAGNFGETQLISPSKDAWDVHIFDINNDGYMDVLASFNIDNKIAWYENEGEGVFGGTFPNERIISINENDFIFSIYADDLDNDGDLDVLSAAQTDNKMAWHENDGFGNFSSQRILSNQVEGAKTVYTADLNNDGYVDVVGSSEEFNNSEIVWFENLLARTPVTIKVFNDFNKNGIYEDNEPGTYNQQLLLSPSLKTTFTDEEGNAYFFLANGTYELSYIFTSPPFELTTIPQTYTITITNDTEPPIYYFGLKPARSFPRVESYLSSAPTRCNEEVTYWLHYSNTGTKVINGKISLEIDELMELISSNPVPDLIQDNSLVWSFSDLNPTLEEKIELQFQMPNQNSIGETLKTKATAQIFEENGISIYNQSVEYNSTLLCSYDPNDKLVRSNLLGQSEIAYIGDTLLYTIRFQNTGNDVAFNIRIEDVLDKKLDWTTFYSITASHDYRTELNRETGFVTFYFDNIMLPDSTSNEVESHGFVTFGIASLTNLEDKTELENTASIFFDFNPPIITNTVSSVLIELDDVNIPANTFMANKYKHEIETYPNPFSDFTTIEVINLPEGKYQLELVNIFGQKTWTSIGDGTWTIQREGLKSGVYLFRISSIDGKTIGEGKVLVE